MVLDEANNYDKACKIYDEYREVFQKEHRAVYNSFIDSQRAFGMRLIYTMNKRVILRLQNYLENY